MLWKMPEVSHVWGRRQAVFTWASWHFAGAVVVPLSHTLYNVFVCVWVCETNAAPTKYPFLVMIQLKWIGPGRRQNCEDDESNHKKTWENLESTNASDFGAAKVSQFFNSNGHLLWKRWRVKLQKMFKIFTLFPLFVFFGCLFICKTQKCAQSALEPFQMPFQCLSNEFYFVCV